MKPFQRAEVALLRAPRLHGSALCPRVPGRSIKMAQSPYHGLWNPAVGIVFASAPDPLYPRLDLSKHIHTTKATESQTTDTKIDGEKSNEPIPSPSLEQAESSRDAEPAASIPLQQSSSALAEKEPDTDSQEPPLTDLEYRISEEAFHKAKKATRGSPESYWSYTLYRGPEQDGTQNKVKVHYCKSKHTMERVCQYFLDEKVLGFDLEWVAEANRYSGPRRNVSLIQLASPSRIALFHVALFAKDNDFVAPTFRKIMEDSSVSKVGVAIKADCTRMKNYLGVDTKGIFELSHLYKLVKYSSDGQVELINKRLVPLAAQVKEFLHLPLFKGQDVRSSDWTQPLNMDQIVYSASDAYAGLQLYHVLEQHREALEPCPPRPYFAELGLPIRLASGDSISSVDESAEATEPVDAEDASVVSRTASTTFITTVRETIQVEVDDVSESVVIASTKSVTKLTRSAAKDARVVEADDWLADYRACQPQIRAAPSAIRAYKIWRSNDDLTPADVAKLLRQPPLQTNTVLSYILEAIRLEKLPFDSTRLRDEVLSQLPKEVLVGRYKTISKMVEQTELAKSRAENKSAQGIPGNSKR